MQLPEKYKENFDVSSEDPSLLGSCIPMTQGEGREGVETAIHRASPSVMRASRGVRRSNCKQIWLRVYDPSEVACEQALKLN
jgi:hypothetical protein